MAMPPAPAFAAKLNEQIANEFAAHQQYVACAVYYDSEALPQLAGFFYRQALEERDHAMMMGLDSHGFPLKWTSALIIRNRERRSRSC